MSGKSAGANALETGSEIERKDEFEGSKEDSEGGSTIKSPAALVALQTISDEGLVPWASLHTDELLSALLAQVEGQREHEECIVECVPMLKGVNEAAIDGAPLSDLTLPDPLDWLSKKLIKACTSTLTLEELTEDYDYLERIFKQLSNNKEEALKEHRDANNKENNTNGDENDVASDTSTEEAINDGNTVRSVKTKTGKSVVQKGDGLKLEALLAATTESTPALEATVASEAKTLETEQLLAPPVATTISTTTEPLVSTAVPAANPVLDEEATPR
jgi:hypothetical protein